MKKKELVIKIDRRLLYTFIVLGILAVIGVGVYAYGTSSPSTFGHSLGEIDFSQTITEDITTTGKVSASEICLGTDCSTSLTSKGKAVYEITNTRCSDVGKLVFSTTCSTTTCGGNCQSYYVYRYDCSGNCVCATSGGFSCPNTLQGYLVN